MGRGVAYRSPGGHNLYSSAIEWQLFLAWCLARSLLDLMS